jgi:pimeloyl-ACP methyl ester carboxylesterase
MPYIKRMDILTQEEAGSGFPDGVVRWTTASGVDGVRDRALVYPGRAKSRTWFVVIHGHGSHEDQLYVRPDIRAAWLEPFLATGAGILTPNLRDNAWMSPAAVRDLHALLDAVRDAYGAARFLFFSGSMGGSSNLFYALHHPEDVAALAALGAAPEPAAYVRWCRTYPGGSIQRQIADAIEAAYGGPPEALPSLYQERDAAARAHRLAMPVYFSHGENDALMPVHEARRLEAAARHHPAFRYAEIAGGSHDSPLLRPGPMAWILAQARDMASGRT